jgi:hypothetical protein
MKERAAMVWKSAGLLSRVRDVLVPELVYSSMGTTVSPVTHIQRKRR